MNSAPAEEYRRGKPLLHTEELCLNTKLEEVIGVESWSLFTTLDIKPGWIAFFLPVVEWATKEDFQIAKSFVHAVKVVNNAAERNVKWIRIMQLS